MILFTFSPFRIRPVDPDSVPRQASRTNRDLSQATVDPTGVPTEDLLTPFFEPDKDRLC